MAVFRVPIKLCGPKARNKARVAYMLGGPDRSEDGRQLPPCYLPEPGSRIVYVSAGTATGAGLELRKTILPDDPRPILGRSSIRFFARP